MQIRDRMNNLRQLSESATDPAEYFQEMLATVVFILSARGGAIWTRGGEGLHLQCTTGIGDEAISERHLFEPSHRRLLEKSFSEGASSAIQASRDAKPTENNGNPTDLLLLLCPVKKKSQAVALVEIFQRTACSTTVQRGCMTFLQQMCYLAGDSTVIGDRNAAG